MSADEGLIWIEQRVLHTVLTQPSRLADLNLQALHFSLEKHAELFELVLQENQKTTADFVNVTDAAERANRKHIGFLATELACDRNLWPSTNLAGDAGSIIAGWRSREAVGIAAALREGAARRDADAVDVAITALMGLHIEERDCEQTAQTAMRAAWDQVMAAKDSGGRVQGVSTGLSELDGSLGGLHNSDLIVVGARPAMGKTGLLLGMTAAGARSAGPVGLISGEQPHEQVGMRWMAAGSHVSLGKLRAGKLYAESEWANVSRAVKDFSALPIRILDRSAPDIAEVVRVARRWKHQFGIKALYVDYLQRIEIAARAKAPKHERVGEITRTLKNLARDLQIPVIALAQVSRDAEDAPRPQMRHLADSSEIEKEADQIMMLWRDLSDPEAKTAPAEINVVKNRHGNIGTVHCIWHGGSTSFLDRASEADERIAA